MPSRLLNLNELSGFTQANPYSVPFGGSANELDPVLAIESLTPEQKRALLNAILPDRPIDSIPDPRVTQEMTPVTPTLRDRLAMFASDAFGSDPRGRRRQETFRNIVDVLDPGFQILSDANSAFGRGDYLSGAVQGGLGLAGVIPGVGPALRRAGAGVGRARNRVGTTGQYVGAPAGVDTPQKLGGIRRRYKDAVLRGGEGANWYQDSSDWIRRVTDDNDVARTAAADIIGLTSANTGVDTNLGFAIKGINQRAAGYPVNTGQFPDWQSKAIENILSGNEINYYPKLTPFMQNLAVNWRPELATTPVHDIWQGRAFGFKGKPTKKYPEGKPWEAGFSPQQHAWMDEQTDVIVDQLANQGEVYDPLSLQAAAWTGAKIDAGKIKPGEGALHYGDFSPKYQAFGTYEQIPGQGTGHLEGIVNRPFGERDNFNSLVNWRGPQGRDRLYSSAGMLVEPTIDNLGVFTPHGTQVTEFNPANIARPLVQSKGDVLPADRSLLSTVEATRAYVDAQNAGAWHRIIPESQTNAGQRTGLQLELGRPVTREELERLNDLAAENGYFAVDYGNGVRFLNDDYNNLGNKKGVERAEKMSEPNQRTGTTDRRMMQASINDIVPEEVGSSNLTRVKIDSDYIDFENNLRKSMEGSGAATEQVFEILDANPTIRDAIEADVKLKAQQNLARDADFSEANNLPVREDIQNARRIVAEGGFDALREALKRQEFLPAVIGAILAPSFFGQDQEI